MVFGIKRGEKLGILVEATTKIEGLFVSKCH